MATVDLHVHSKHSDHPSEWFLQRIGANESYTEPETIYSTAKERGMDFVTITDHNTIAGVLQLKKEHPDDVFMGVESTAYFPEDGCKVHILIYDFTEQQFDDIQRLRKNIYELRDYIKAQNLPYSVAHATYSVNGKLTIDHIEKLLLLFDVFEGINGGRGRMSNEGWLRLLKHLTPEHFNQLRAKHGITSMSDDPWKKGVTGGSDDHAGLFMGKTATVAMAATPGHFLAALRARATSADGRHNDYQSLAFVLYKIAYDFSQTQGNVLSNSLLSQLSGIVFNRGSLSFANRLRVKKLRSFTKHSRASIQGRIADLIFTLQNEQELPVEQRLNLVYDNIAAVADTFFINLVSSLQSNLERGDLSSIVTNISAALPGLFISIPFFSTLAHMYRGRSLVTDLHNRFSVPAPRHKRVLWFTDTITDLNGVSSTLKNMGWAAYQRDIDLTLVTSITSPASHPLLPPNLINLPGIHSFSLPHYEECTLHIPSVLKSLEIIYDCQPDQVYISTPGPIGLFGILAARLLNVPATGIYHTDFTMQAAHITDDDSITGLLETYTRWFFSLMDEILVPTKEYIQMLESRGFNTQKMKLFPRGIDTENFRPMPEQVDSLKMKYGLPDGPVLCYAGRISKDKNLDFLARIFMELKHTLPDCNLIVAGDGPYLQQLKDTLSTHEGVLFTGRLEHEQLPEIYACSDVFVFPSTTDTYGMAVLEALACGIPAIVSDQGGPKELVLNNLSGCVLPVHTTTDWVNQISRILLLKETKPDCYRAMQAEARNSVVSKASWDIVLSSLCANATCSEACPSEAHATAPVPAMT